MGKKFLQGTELYMYECLMQETPNLCNNLREERKQKNRYIGKLKEFMRDLGYRELTKKVLTTMDVYIFEETFFFSEDHKERFWKMYDKFLKSNNSKSNTITAVIYLLSTQSHFCVVLENYLSNPQYKFPKMVKSHTGLVTYNIYHAAKMIAGIESGLMEEDLFEDGVIDVEILCLIINAKFICQYGINGYNEKKRKKKEPYINNTVNHRRKQKNFSYKGQTLKIK